jgi:hypothetical protein
MQRSGRLAVWVAAILCCGAILIAFAAYQIYFHLNYYVVEYNEYSDPPPKDDLELTDDWLSDKQPAFKETLIDSRPLGDWEVNASAAVIRLDCPTIKPGADDGMLELNPNYGRAIRKAAELQKTLLPSANLIDGAAKQFDDGLYAALDLACYQGKLGFAASAPDLAESLFSALPEKSPARPFLAGALELAGKPQKLSAEEQAEKAKWLAEFAADEVRSKPISFYIVVPELPPVWKFFRYLQWDLATDSEKAVSADLSAALARSDKLVPPYRSICQFYDQLTNPPLPRLQPLVDFAGPTPTAPFVRTVFPPSTSRETVLFETLYAEGIPASVNLMSDLIRQIRSGKVNLQPSENDGWYQYQAYALESMLLPTDAQENEKLMLTAAYKKRLVEAFKALLTKRRETHARQLPMAACEAKALENDEVRPRLRVEPCASFYLRTARAYAFVEKFLLMTVGEENLSGLHGFGEWGRRERNLARELADLRLRFYGFYLVSCEDLGMEPKLLADEPVDQGAAKEAALKWLARLDSSDLHVEVPELTADARVSVPIARDLSRNVTRLWATLGVRLVPLNADYARRPKVRAKEKGGEWEDPPSYAVGKSDYVLAVDEFAEFELPGSASLTREEFRAICDKNKGDKERILQDLKARREQQ